MSAQQTAAQASHRSFSVALIGAEQSDQVTLNRIFGITRYRTRRYNLIPLDTGRSDADTITKVRGADIHIINIHNPGAMVLWSRIAASIPAEQRRPVIRIARESSNSNKNDLTLTWPINPAKVLQILDSYTIAHLDFIPEMEIGSESALAGQALEKVAYINQHRKKPAAGGKKIRALVADDSLPVRRQLQIEFNLLGSDLHLVEDGEAALQAAQQHSYDIIFLDVIMPGMDGYGVCKNIRRTPKNRNTPVVLLTSKSSSFDKLKGKLAGCDTYLTKPINHNEFTDITRKHLNRMEK